MKNKILAIISKEGKIYVAENPETGVVSQGYSVEEAIKNLKEAVELYLEEMNTRIEEKEILITTINL
jgi:predicted RNase H-like HicB family nuclease